MPRVISIHSYRGGTGKSNLTANLATTVANQGYRVGVVDTDLPSPGIHNIFGLEPDRMAKTLNSYLWNEAEIEDGAYDVSQNLDLAQGGQLFLVPASSSADDIARILKDGYDVRRLNDGFRQLVKTLELDYLFIDTHPGLSKETFLTIAISHCLLLIVRPDKQDYQGAAVTLDVARQLNVKHVQIVLNKVLACLDPEALKQKVEEIYRVPVAGLFPLSEDIIKLASEGVFCVRHPEHSMTQEFQAVARRVMK
ncbi:MinD/ParA family protein [Nodosilinea sp. LEGE 07298]|uniref:MinD/ParA family ATP-binding protein n=1 Tax=Nodosilinea sp. LEGE 07298 TaxID=2777970 RepID=UPI00187E68D6|nr:MinD/ParA family protein [Nodosilinea sp. LEGE 07298]MBE9111850.1 MinD/ParA family protein [Nodosilinea sp. LEGE 07298]